MNAASEKRILLFSCAAHFFTHFAILTFPALVMPIGRDLMLSVSQVVNISFTMYLLYGVLAVPWGYVSDRWGHKWAMALGILITGIGLAAAGLLRASWAMSIAFALVGIGCAAYHPSGMAIISQGVTRRGRALGINGIWGTAGIAAAPFAAGWLNLLLGWRGALIALGTVGVVLGVVIWAFPLSVQRGTDRLTIDALENKTAQKLFLIFAFGMIFSGFMYRSYTVILPSFLEYRLGDLAGRLRVFFIDRFPRIGDSASFDTLIANLVVTGIYLVGIVGQAIGGRVADRFSLKWSYLLCFCLAVPCALGMVLLRNATIVLAGGAFVFFTLGMQPIENSVVAFLTPARWRSVSYGIKSTLLFGVGSFAVKLVGHAESVYGIDQVMWLVLGFLILVIANTTVMLIASRGLSLRHSGA